MKIIKNKAWLTAIVIVFAIIFLFIAFRFLKNGRYGLYEVKKGDFTQTVTISGKVVPAQEIDLGFEVSGEVKNVFVEIGDEVQRGQILASLNQFELSNEIKETAASLQSEIAKLSELTGMNSPEDQSQLKSAKIEMLSVLNKAQSTADNLIRNKVDVFFQYPTKRFPEFDVSLTDFVLRKSINEKRVEIEKMLNEWKARNLSLTLDNVTFSDVEYTIKSLKEIQDILVTISTGTTDFTPSGDVTQSQIDAYISSISQARTTISDLIIQVNQIAESVRQTEAEIPIQEAKVKNAQATVSKLNSRTDKYVIRAPFSGVITAKEIEVGEISEIGKTSISMIEDSDFEVEVFIPEVRISGVEVGNEAKIKLDAFGDDKVFKATLSHIDPRETEKDGITTYRGVLNFVEDNEGVRIGMTAEVEIEKQKIQDAIFIPLHLVITEGDKNYVELQNGKISKKEIFLGPRDGKGSVIVESGLNVGDKIIVPN